MLPGLIDGAPDVISQALLNAPIWENEHINGFVKNRLMQNPAKFDYSIKQNDHVLDFPGRGSGFRHTVPPQSLW